ncbi:follicle-stimulating hormone receptor [Hydra vulgaris]|uniref:Follicle-stimulating hormone receptor n=1 Tax=Hydra vulgaris TaxID=6087 RepID=A0ABM4C142_HYDVU
MKKLKLLKLLCFIVYCECQYYMQDYETGEQQNFTVQSPIRSKTLEMTMMNFLSIPTTILKSHPDVTALQLPYNKIRYIGKHDFPESACREIRYINLNGNFITRIDEDAFSNMPWLLEIDLSNNLLTEVPKIKAPKLRKIHMDKNKIKTVSAESMIHYKSLEHLDLGFNEIESIEPNTFAENKELYWLVLKNNPLRSIADNAFKGAKRLNTLLLQNTLISQLPPQYGISTLETLNIMKVPSLFTIPDPENFKKLKKIFVTYSMHCCAFKIEREIPKLNNTKPCPTESLQEPNGKTKRSQEKNKTAFNNQIGGNSSFGDMLNMFGDIYDAFNTEPQNYSLCSGLGELVGGKPFDTHIKIECTPEPDAFNPCQDVMGSNELRGFSWIIGICAIIGNVFQLVILFYSRQELTVYKLLMYNLGVSNLLMGIYLIVLCCVDAYTFGKYYNYVQSWQFKGGCQVFGFLALFATSLSVCSLVLITFERYLLIIFALSVENQMKLRHAKVGVIFSWVYSFLIASLPVANTVSSYSKTAICLPMDTATAVAEGYLVWLLLVYVLAFLFIVVCYVRIYYSINDVRPGVPNSQNIDIKVAKRMAMIIFSNFFCWLPISIVGLIAMYGGKMLDVRVAKFLIVFIFPLNACTNPFLYAIFTKVFRADTIRILNSCGLFKHVEEERQRAPSYFKSKKRSATNISHFMHFQSPDQNRFNTRNCNEDIEQQTEFDGLETPLNSTVCSSIKPQSVMLEDGNGINNKCFRENKQKRSNSYSYEGKKKELRYRTESNETSSTRMSLHSNKESDEDDFTKIGCSVQEASVLLA